MKNLKILCSCVAALPLFSNAAIIPVFNEDADISNFDTGTLAGDVGFEGNGSDLLNLWDRNVSAGIAASFDLPSAITTGLQLSFTLSNISDGADSTHGIYLRLMNTDAAANSASNYGMQFGFMNDGDMDINGATSAYGSGGNRADVGSLALSTTYAISVVVNTAQIGGANLAYEYNGDERILEPGQMEFYINNQLVDTDRTHMRSNSGYTAADGVGRIGFFASSLHTGMEVLLGDVNVYTGSDIVVVPEPAVVSLFMGLSSLVLVCVFRQHRKSILTK